MFELTAQDYQEAAARLRQRRGVALSWLNQRFSNVRDEEISDQVANDIAIIQEWEEKCAYCTDIKKCKHSCSILVVCEEGIRGGFRTFYTRARQCDLCEEAMANAPVTSRRRGSR
ncbi:MAG: hypothetical protein K6E42_08920 [Synergistes sp.]|nr:hypothetical protein [Synergistes sp.]